MLFNEINKYLIGIQQYERLTNDMKAKTTITLLSLKVQRVSVKQFAQMNFDYISPFFVELFNFNPVEFLIKSNFPLIINSVHEVYFFQIGLILAIGRCERSTKQKTKNTGFSSFLPSIMNGVNVY